VQRPDEGADRLALVAAEERNGFLDLAVRNEILLRRRALRARHLHHAHSSTPDLSTRIP
jgi:hypothetical protein